jgi:hypothetical protein
MIVLARFEATSIDEVPRRRAGFRERCPFLVPPLVFEATKLHERRKR